MNYEQQAVRYQHDPGFHRLVDHLYGVLLQGKFSVEELKDAAVFAANKFACERIVPPPLLSAIGSRYVK